MRAEWDNAVPPALAALRAAGEALFGPGWQRPMARALGPFHPSGPREAVDDRLVRRWASGERAVPAWVPGALPRLLDAAAAAREADAAGLRALAARLAAGKGRGTAWVASGEG